MIFLIYASSATQEMTESELLNILNKARENNTKLGITGMLLYHENNFLQVLEGEAEEVENLYQKILLDPRHTQISAIIKRPIVKREFGDWKMGFVNLETVNPDELPGFSDYMQKPMTYETFEQDPSYAQVFLETFRDLAR
jgi:hypothetical protein